MILISCSRIVHIQLFCTIKDGEFGDCQLLSPAGVPAICFPPLVKPEKYHLDNIRLDKELDSQYPQVFQS